MSFNNILTSKIITLVVIMVYSCSPKENEFTIEPKIQLESVVQHKNILGKDSIIQLTISYSDSDGDIGLSDSDTLPPFNFSSDFYHNLPIKFLVMDSSGSFNELINPTLNQPYGNQHERVPYLTPPGKHKSISGFLTINLAANPLFLDPKTVKFEISLMDRALNMSNTVYTEVLNLTH
jgi:hypothetical protein